MMLLGGSEEASVMLRWAEVRVPSERMGGRTNPTFQVVCSIEILEDGRNERGQ